MFQAARERYRQLSSWSEVVLAVKRWDSSPMFCNRYCPIVVVLYGANRGRPGRAHSGSVLYRREDRY